MQGNDVGFDPEVVSWQASQPGSTLLGDWYRNGELSLVVTQDSISVEGVTSRNWMVDNFESYYRVIYEVDEDFFSLYLNSVSRDSMGLAFTDGRAANAENARNLRIIDFWYVLTSSIPWVPSGVPAELYGYWHVEDNVLELRFTSETVTIDGVVWEISAVETNYRIDRLILSRNNATIAFYYRNLRDGFVDVLMVSTTDDIQDRHGDVHGDWRTVTKWYSASP